MFDEVRVYFKDDTSTIIYVAQDDSIQDAIVELCENEGWNLFDVIDYSIIGQVEPGE